MLIRPHDAAIDPEREWRDLVADHPFGHLIAPGKEREFPVVVPTHIHFDGDRTIRLHLARPNPVWPALLGCALVGCAYLLVGGVLLAFAERRARVLATLPLS